ncbi:unnamed protein product [Microthlaspi erraticum]|uniref:Uncharacterized protein n=1 Tax=Microthlaspi erraticum TaxID=1685480 RepID=A0A6D2K850_9BRAS|nr:unnamed protein product [Microthlaspi erraticum]
MNPKIKPLYKIAGMVEKFSSGERRRMETISPSQGRRAEKPNECGVATTQMGISGPGPNQYFAEERDYGCVGKRRDAGAFAGSTFSGEGRGSIVSREHKDITSNWDFSDVEGIKSYRQLEGFRGYDEQSDLIETG